MTSATERAYFKWHAQENFSGVGEIVDLGSWFGSTTAAMAMGLRANQRPAARRVKIKAYDRFTWEPWMDLYASAARLGPYSAGDSFLPEFERVVRPWRERIQVHAGDLLEQSWSQGPIEVLLVDAMKSWELTLHILTHFYCDLTLPDSCLIHQDFSNCFTPWIPLVSYRLRDHFAPVQDIPRSETVVFRVLRPFERDADALRLTRASFDETEVREAFEHSLRITRAEKHSGIHAASAMLLVYDGDIASANERLHRLESERRLSEYHANAVRGAIERAGRAHES
jgi:hypothetical protein